MTVPDVDAPTPAGEPDDSGLTSAIRVVIADDVVRRGLRQLLDAEAALRW
jgi:hypothetical protein